MRQKLMKLSSTGLALALSAVLLASCGGGTESTTTAPGTTEGTTTAEVTDEPTDAPTDEPTDEPTDTDNGSGAAGAINVWTRDSASGTRGAFEEIVGFEGELVDTATETSGNGDMAAKVGADEFGIGYVSLTTDFEANNLKKVNLDGVEPTEENTLSGDYAVSRPFNLVTRAEGDFESDEIEQLTAAFADFILNSTEGLEAVYSEGGIVDPDSGTSWDDLAANHPIVEQDNSSLTLRTAGSTSVLNTLNAALAAFQPLAGNFQISVNHTGSGDGYKRVLGGEKDGSTAAEIGFASRDFNDDEAVDAGLVHGTYAMDAVVVVVSEDNPVTDLTLEQVASIFKGEITDWSELG